jgi:uncharacterized membrane protein YdbT with pleckstrin-like domain
MSTKLMPGERPISLARQHWSVIAPSFIVAAISIVAGIVILAVVPSTVAGHNVTGVKLIIALVLVLIAVVWTFLNYLRWRFKTYLLTDRRVVVESGVVSRLVESIPLDRIQNTVIRRPLGDRIIGAGDVEIESAGRDGVEVLHRIPKAESFYTELLQAIEATRLGPAGMPPGPPGGV